MMKALTVSLVVIAAWYGAGWVFNAETLKHPLFLTIGITAKQRNDDK